MHCLLVDFFGASRINEAWLINSKEVSTMPAIVEFPEVVKEALPQFADCFSCDPQRRHFLEYLTGLMVAAKKTISGMHAEFADTTDQSVC